MTTILIVDDDQDIRELLAFKLSAAGFDVHTAVDGESAVAAAISVRPDLMLLDWMMPRFSGLEVCAELRSREEFAALPVILLTAKAQESDVERGLAAGADDYITKPFSPREALSRVESALARTRRIRQVGVDAGTSATANERDPAQTGVEVAATVEIAATEVAATPAAA